MNKIEFIKHTENTVDSKEKLLKALNEIRRLGYAEDNEELANGLVCVAAPIFNQYSHPFAAISLSGPVIRMKKVIRKQVGSILCGYTHETSKNRIRSVLAIIVNIKRLKSP